MQERKAVLSSHKASCHLKILSARMEKGSKFKTDDRQTLGATVLHSVAAICARLLTYVYATGLRSPVLYKQNKVILEISSHKFKLILPNILTEIPTNILTNMLPNMVTNMPT